MRKTALLTAIIALCAAMAACGNTNIPETESQSDPAAAPAETDAEAETELPAEAETAPDTESLQLDRDLYWYGIHLRIPYAFEDEYSSGNSIFKEVRENGDEVVFLYYSYAYYVSMTEDNDFTENDVPDILNHDVYMDVNKYIPTFESTLAFSVETEESVTILDCPFIHRTGMMHTERGDDSADVPYAAYYGVIRYDEYDIEKAPAFWLVFSDTDDPETIQYMQDVVQNAAESASFD